MSDNENVKAIQRDKNPSENRFYKHLDYATAGRVLCTLMRDKHASRVRFFKNF